MTLPFSLHLQKHDSGWWIGRVPWHGTERCLNSLGGPLQAGESMHPFQNPKKIKKITYLDTGTPYNTEFIHCLFFVCGITISVPQLKCSAWVWADCHVCSWDCAAWAWIGCSLCLWADCSVYLCSTVLAGNQRRAQQSTQTHGWTPSLRLSTSSGTSGQIFCPSLKDTARDIVHWIWCLKSWVFYY